MKNLPVILHITNIPTPYRLPYFREVGSLLRSHGIDLHVFFLGKGKRQREWKLGEADMQGFEWTLHPDPESGSITPMIRAIRAMKPDVVVLAWAMDLTALRLLLYCRRHRIPCMVMTGETAHTAAGRSHPAIRNAARQPFFRLADMFLTYGTRTAEYLRRNGVPASRITVGLNVVDTSFFRERVDALRASGEGRWEGAPFGTHLLMVNYMIPGKGISSTLRALALLDRPDIALHIVGSGPREEAHRALAHAEGLDRQVFFHGYRQLPEVLRFYAFADIFLFPSSIDIFGLVMVESAAAGLPTIASGVSGGTADVVVDGVTGIVLDPHDIDVYARAIAMLADDPELRARMGSAARARSVEHLTLARSAGHYLEAVSSLIGTRGR